MAALKVRQILANLCSVGYFFTAHRPHSHIPTQYISGFGNENASEALPGALPKGQVSGLIASYNIIVNYHSQLQLFNFINFTPSGEKVSQKASPMSMLPLHNYNSAHGCECE